MTRLDTAADRAPVAVTLAREVIDKYGADADKPSVKLAIALLDGAHERDRLRAELETLEARRIHVEARTTEIIHDRDAARAELAQVRAERDVALSKLCKRCKASCIDICTTPVAIETDEDGNAIDRARGDLVVSVADADLIADLLETRPGPTPAMLAAIDRARSTEEGKPEMSRENPGYVAFASSTKEKP